MCIIFDPSAPKNLLPESLLEIFELNVIPFFTSGISSWDKDFSVPYLEELETQYQQYRNLSRSNMNVKQFWNYYSHWTELSSFALTCVSIPVGASSPERVFSIYTHT